MSYINDYMNIAIDEAKTALKENEIPVGCVIVKSNNIIAKCHNAIQKDLNSLHHAEMLCIDKALKKLGEKQLCDCDMYVTLEPCPMCMGAIMNSRVKRLYIGAADNLYGAAGSKYDLSNTLNHKCEVYFGICEDECKNLIKKFFNVLREKH